MLISSGTLVCLSLNEVQRSCLKVECPYRCYTRENIHLVMLAQVFHVYHLLPEKCFRKIRQSHLYT